MLNLARFQNLHAGQRCVVVCNGPSLNAMNLRILQSEVVIGLNKIHLGLDRFGFYPRYLVAVNGLVIEQSRDALAAMSCIKFISAQSADRLPRDALTYHLPILGTSTLFSTDIALGVREGGTVTNVALQIAYYMGFSQVILIGLDHRYEFSGLPHERRHLTGPDSNHFSPDYFGNQDWQNPDLARSEEAFAAARRVFEADGRQIIDATVNGACPIFPKAQFPQILGQSAG